MLTLRILLLLVFFGLLSPLRQGSAAPSFAFFYAKNPPVDELKAFDIVVLDPASGVSPDDYGSGKSELMAYVSVGETQPAATYRKLLNDKWIIGENPAWGSVVMDPSDPSWRRFFLERVIDPLWRDGYRGFFLDTIDSYRLAVGKERYPAMEEGLVEMVREIRKNFPGARLILNRGFEILDRLRGEVFAVAAESLFCGYSPARGYYDVPEDDRKWLLEKMNTLKKDGLPVIAIDYLEPGRRDRAREVAENILALGLIPWVTDKELASLGVGSIEVMPRKILGLYDGVEAHDPTYTNILRLAAMPLNYLGYQLELHDMRDPLPSLVMEGRYAGVVVWPTSDSSAGPGFRGWLEKTINEGVRVVFLDFFGIGANDLPEAMGIVELPEMIPKPPLRIVEKGRLIGFEAPPLPQADSFQRLRMKKGEVLLKVSDAAGNVYDAAGIGSWGGYVRNPFVVSPDFRGQISWEIDPFAFFTEALDLPEMPVPDTTTENGVRLLMSHVDGDGFSSRAEWPGGGYAALELHRSILKRYRLPVTVGVITGEIAPNGLFPSRSADLERIAREIYLLPWVEAGSHSFSHPFRWFDLGGSGEGEGYHLKIPGYSFDPDAEIGGSIDYINQRLLPEGKRVRLFQWTGNCVPGEEAIARTYGEGVGNINGGETKISHSSTSLTMVAPLGVSKKGWFQVYAPNQNENVYTNLWTSDFYGYHRVLETFRLTDSPRRLKPVDIYYHFYSATKKGSLKALEEVYSWAAGERLNPVFTSEYVEKAIDFNRTVVARTDQGWLVRNGGFLREMRIPERLGFPVLAKGSNVSGFSRHEENRYIHLGTGGEAVISLASGMGGEAFIEQLNGVLGSFGRNGRGFVLSFHGWSPVRLVLGNAGRCALFEGKRKITPRAEAGGRMTFEFPEGRHEISLECR